MKIEDIKKKFVITPEISELKLNIDNLLSEKDSFNDLLKKSLPIIIFVVFLISYLYSYLFLISIIFYVFWIYKKQRKFKAKTKEFLDSYNNNLNYSSNILNYYLANEEMNLYQLNNYNIFFSNLKRKINDGIISCDNLNFIKLSTTEFGEEIYRKQKEYFPYLFNHNKFSLFRSNKNKEQAVIDFFIIANTRFNLGANILYFIDLYEKEITSIYIVIDNDPKYRLTDKDLPLVTKRLLEYTFEFLDIRIKYNKEKKFEEQRNSQNEVSKKIELLLREVYLLNNPISEDKNKKENINHRKKI